MNVTLVGAGNMGGAMLEGWIESRRTGLRVIDPAIAPERRKALEERGVAFRSNGHPDVVVIAVKPQIMDAVLVDIADIPGSDTLIVSVAAGIPMATYERHFGEAARVVRVMPNTPAAVGRGVSVCFANPNVDEGDREAATGLLEAIGSVEWIESETSMDAVTGLSGSGPAYVFALVEALAEAGRSEGLEPDLAERLARATVSGAGELLHRSSESASTLRRNVTSPGGTTAAGLEVLRAELPDLARRTVAAAAQRSRELAS